MAAAPEVLDVSLAARRYVAVGWALVPIPARRKFPNMKGWNRRENCVTTLAGCARIKGNVGIAHAYSRTCVLDFDDMIKSRAWLASHGIDLDDLWNDPEAVRISSGRANRGKLLFKLPDNVLPLRTHPLHEHGIELRCAAASGRTVQDVLPPSIHPDTGEAYAWEYAEPALGDWRTPPVLPTAVLEVWRSVSESDAFSLTAGGQGDIERARATLEDFDPNVGYHDWIKVGMALHHEFEGAYEGFELWDEWSAAGQEYKGTEDLEYHWETFDADREGAMSTLDSLEASVRRRPLDPEVFDELMEAEQAAPPPAQVSDSAEDFDDLTSPDHQQEAAPEDNLQADLAAAPKKVKGFKFQTVDEFLERSPPAWIIKGLLPKATMGLMYGESGAGKSFMALDQAMAVALGKDWRGRKTKQGTVAYIVAEGATGFQDRILAYCRMHDVDRSALPLRVLPAAPDMMDSKKDSPNGVVELGRALKALGPVSVIYVDTYARVMGAGNENEAKDTNTIVANCALLHRVTGAIVVLIHHSGKNSERGARGSGALRAAADVEYAITKASGRRTMTVTKMKDGEDGQAYHFKLQSIVIGLDEDGEDRSSCVVEHTDETTSVAEQLDAQPVKPTSEVQARILEQLGTYLAGRVDKEIFIQDVRAITPVGPNGVENPSWKALITRPLQKMINKGIILESNGELYLPKPASD